MILADSGFWLALANRRDPWHAPARAALLQWAGERLVSTWPVVTEAWHLLALRVGGHAAVAFISHLEGGAADIAELPRDAAGRMRKLLEKYRDLPMDLADASLVVLAEELGEGRILSTDTRDFGAYRWKNTKPFTNLLLPEPT